LSFNTKFILDGILDTQEHFFSINLCLLDNLNIYGIQQITVKGTCGGVSPETVGCEIRSEDDEEADEDLKSHAFLRPVHSMFYLFE
jgi:hypothetical protein